jgi:membrane protease YdiL (CAAX protease family)
VLDYALMVCLILLLPAFSLWKSLRKPAPLMAVRSSRYAWTAVRVAILLLVLAIDWYGARRSPDALGLDLPVSPRGQIGLAIAAIVVVALLLSSWFERRRASDAKLAAYQLKLENNDLLPRTSTEMWGFMGLSLMIGAGWELLYRGFLLWGLAPVIGTAGAIVITALAYGLAHGYKSRGQLAGSIVSAFIFTIAYATTHSLWWLMILHVAVGLAGGLNSYRMLGTNSGLRKQGQTTAVG